ncbi:hypothetical protein [Sodalis sp. C49]|uniref:hypothetical protein n=1 Tax=Sodalis sp. C49 TaxID=3228929 RepID=UPI003965AEF0
MIDQNVFANTIINATGYPSYNFGKSSVCSNGVADGQGEAPFYCMPDGGIIPSSGAVHILPNTAGPLATFTMSALRGVKAPPAGVDGVFNWDGPQASFTRDASGAAANVSAQLPLFIYPYTSSTVTG